MTTQEIVLALFVAVFSAWVAWVARAPHRVRTNDLHDLGEKIDEMKRLNRQDHEKFFDRIGTLETAVAILKEKAGVK